MSFLKVTYGKIFLTAIIFALVIFFLFPIKVNAMCAGFEDCPQLIDFIKINEIFKTSTLVGINYWIILVELFISYVFAAGILTLSGRGGVVPLVSNQKLKINP